MLKLQFHVHNHSADGNSPDEDHVLMKKQFFPTYGTVVTSSDENKTGGNNSHNANAAPHNSASHVVLGLQVLFAFIELIVEFRHRNYSMVAMNASMVLTGLLSLFAHWKSKQHKSSNSSHEFNTPPENRDDGSDDNEYDPAAIATGDFSGNDVVACLIEESDVESTATTAAAATTAAIATTSRFNADDEITRKQIHCFTLCVWVVSMCVFEVLIGPFVETWYLNHVIGRCKRLFAMTPQHKELGENLCSRGEFVPAKLIAYALGLVIVSLAIFNLYRFYAEAAEAAEAAALAENVHVGTVTAIYFTEFEDVELCHSESKGWLSEQPESGRIEADPEPQLVACSNCIELTEQQHLL